MAWPVTTLGVAALIYVPGFLPRVGNFYPWLFLVPFCMLSFLFPLPGEPFSCLNHTCQNCNFFPSFLFNPSSWASSIPTQQMICFFELSCHFSIFPSQHTKYILFLLSDILISLQRKKDQNQHLLHPHECLENMTVLSIFHLFLPL